MYRLDKKKKLHSPKVLKKWGFLYRDMRPGFHWFRVVMVNQSLVLSLCAAHLVELSTKIISYVLLFLLSFLVVAAILPFEKAWQNAARLTIGFGNGVLLLYLFQSQAWASDAIVGALQGLLVCSVLAMCASFAWRLRRDACPFYGQGKTTMQHPSNSSISMSSSRNPIHTPSASMDFSLSPASALS